MNISSEKATNHELGTGPDQTAPDSPDQCLNSGAQELGSLGSEPLESCKVEQDLGTAWSRQTSLVPRRNKETSCICQAGLSGMVLSIIRLCQQIELGEICCSQPKLVPPRLLSNLSNLSKIFVLGEAFDHLGNTGSTASSNGTLPKSSNTTQLPSSTAHIPAKLQASSNLTRRWSNSCGWQWWTKPLVKPTKWRLLLWLLGLQESIMLSIEVPQVNAINTNPRRKIHTETDATRTAHSMHLAALDFTRPDDPNLRERRREMNDKEWLKRGLKWYQSVWHAYHEHSGFSTSPSGLPMSQQAVHSGGLPPGLKSHRNHILSVLKQCNWSSQVLNLLAIIDHRINWLLPCALYFLTSRVAKSVSCMASLTAPANFVSSLGIDFKKSCTRCRGKRGEVQQRHWKYLWIAILVNECTVNDIYKYICDMRFWFYDI